MRWPALVVIGSILVAGCSGADRPETATLRVGGVAFELDDFDCARSDAGFGWTASGSAPKAVAWGNGGRGAGMMLVDAEMPDGGAAFHVIVDPSVVEDDGLVVSGLEGGTAVTLEIPCRDFDPGSGSVFIGDVAGAAAQVACFFDSIAPTVDVRGVADGREFLVSMRRGPALGGGFEDTVEFVWLDTGDEYGARASFAGEPPYDRHSGIFEIDGETVRVPATVLDGPGGAVASSIEVACGLVRRP